SRGVGPDVHVVCADGGGVQGEREDGGPGKTATHRRPESTRFEERTRVERSASRGDSHTATRTAAPTTQQLQPEKTPVTATRADAGVAPSSRPARMLPGRSAFPEETWDFRAEWSAPRTQLVCPGASTSSSPPTSPCRSALEIS